MATHQLARPELGHVDKYRSDKNATAGSSLATAAGKIFVANAGGTTTTVVGAAASLTASTNCARIGERFVLMTSAGVLKENKVFQVTAHNGTTTITFTPAAAASTASGDYCLLVGGVDKDLGGNPYADNDSLDAFLLDMGGIYTQAYIDHMTQNDKIFAIRQHQNADSVK